MKDLKRKKSARHTPLDQQIADDQTVKQRKRTGKLARKGGDEEEDDITPEQYVANTLSRKIVTNARKQAEEVHDEEEEEEEERDDEREGEGERVVDVKGKNKKLAFKTFEELMAEDDQSSVSEISETESQYNQDDMTVNEEDEKALAMFMNPTGTTRLLSDIIMEKLSQHEAALKRREEQKDDVSEREPDLKPEIIQIYIKIGTVLRYFTSGKLPKAFRVLPSLRNWERLLYLTRPDQWTPVVTRLATFLFSRGMSDKLVQRFYYIILLPKVREEIQATRKLNFHYYLALKKSLYRPAAFFRGILLPLCESGDCTLREATIVGSVMKRVSIPAIHASVAIYKLCQMPYYGATQYFMLILLNKKFSLPYKVIDSVYEYFMRFNEDERKLPSLWHNTLLIFAQRYKGDLTSDQKLGLQRLTMQHKHPLFTPEINRELFSAKNRGEPTPTTSTSTSTSTMEM